MAKCSLSDRYPAFNDSAQLFQESLSHLRIFAPRVEGALRLDVLCCAATDFSQMSGTSIQQHIRRVRCIQSLRNP